MNVTQLRNDNKGILCLLVCQIVSESENLRRFRKEDFLNIFRAKDEFNTFFQEISNA